MRRVSHSQLETVTATDMPGHQHLYQGLDDLLPKQAEGVKIGWRGRNRNATGTLQRRDQPVLRIAHGSGEMLALTVDLDVGHKLVVAPQFLPRAVCRLGRNRKIRHVDRRSRI